jgi:quercetin dioxygenase-like cupin family protein
MATLQGPANWFTGTAWIDEIASAEAPSALRVSLVTFEPGARTA